MLNRRDRLILEALLPSGAHASLPYGVAEVNFDAFWSAFERTALPSWHRGFRAALWIATWFAPLLVRRLPPLTLHDRPTRERALAAMEHSRLYLLRQMLGLLKTTVCLGYGADDDVRQAIGYPGRPDERHRSVTS